MNEINVDVLFKSNYAEIKGFKTWPKAVSGDYNSTKMVFNFDREDGTKILEIKNPLTDEIVYKDTIRNNESVLVGYADVLDENNYVKYTDNEENIYWYDKEHNVVYDSEYQESQVEIETLTKVKGDVGTIFANEGDYICEISLYGNDSKLSVLSFILPVGPEAIKDNDKEAIIYKPVFDSLINTVNGKIEEIDEALIDVNNAIDDVNDAIEEVNNLDLDVNKVEKETTVELTKKDGTTKEVKIYDGVSLQFMWQGTSLGVKTDDMQDYVFVNLQGIQGVPGPQGEPFRIKKTYSSVAEMNADFNNMNYGDYVMIASTVEVEDNAKLYTRGEYEWIFITDFSGSQGIKGETGLTPNIQIGTVTSGDTPSVTRTGTNENPVLNFTLQKGDNGVGISSITETLSSADGGTNTYTVNYTNGTSQDLHTKNGSKGSTGNTGNGISSITTQESQEPSGVNTLTITETNGTVTNFNVKNGNGVSKETFEKALPKKSLEGESVSFDDGIDYPLFNFEGDGKSEQKSYSGKNLVNESIIDFTSIGSSKLQWNSIEKVIESINKPNGHFYAFDTPLEAGKTYTLIINFKQGYITKNSGAFDIGMYHLGDPNSWQGKIGGSNLENIDLSNRTFKVTNTATDTVTGMDMFCYGDMEITTPLKFNVLVAEGNVDEYEPYTGSTPDNIKPSPNPDYPQEIESIKGDVVISNGSNNITIALGNTELCSIGGAKDKMIIDCDTGVVSKSNKILKQIYDGSETWTYISTYRGNFIGKSNIRFDVTPICSHYKGRVGVTNIPNNQIGVSSGMAGIIIRDDVNGATARDFKTFLSNNNIEVLFEAKTPTTETITTLSASDLQKLMPTNESNTYIVNTNLGAMNIRITYARDINKLILSLEN